MPRLWRRCEELRTRSGCGGRALSAAGWGCTRLLSIRKSPSPTPTLWPTFSGPGPRSAGTRWTTRSGVVRRAGDLAHRSHRPAWRGRCPNSHDVYWVPRSECTTVPTACDASWQFRERRRPVRYAGLRNLLLVSGPCASIAVPPLDGLTEEDLRDGRWLSLTTRSPAEAPSDAGACGHSGRITDR